MKRVFNKTISFCLVLLMCLGILTPWLDVYAEESNEYILKVIATNEYSDAVRFGDGYLLLKDGKFNNITSKTTYTFVDADGNKREIKNNIGFTKIYLNTSGDTYYVDYGALVVGKDDKVALMDMDGNLYGGSTNFYECVVHAGDNLFYTTNDTAGKSDKADTAVWTLRRKDGSVVKDFTNLNFYRDRVHSNGYEYIMNENEEKSELLVINSNGDITSLGTDISSFNVYGELGYIVTYRYSQNGNGYLISLFNENGTKVFDIDNCNYIDIYGLAKFGFASVSLNKEGEYCETLVDKTGKILYEIGKYSTISYYDDKNAIAIDENTNMYLVDHSDNVIFDVDNFAKEFGVAYKAITFSSYYIDSTLTVTLVDTNKENDPGTSFFFDDKGNEITGNLKGQINNFDGTYASLYDSDTETYGVVSKYGNFEKRDYDYINLLNEGDVVAIADEHSDGSKILIMKDGNDINKYDQLGESQWPYRLFINEHALVKAKGKEQYGIIDTNGNEIIPVGEYSDFVQFDDSECILAYKDGRAYLFDTNGKVLNVEGQYKNIGDYVTNFYKFASGKNWTEYTNGVTSKNTTVTMDANNKLGVVRVVKLPNTFDVNNDGKVDIEDISAIALKYNKTSSDWEWDSKFDFNDDNIIDIYDLTLISKEL